MKVICSGMSKTGTKSMHHALERLGYEVVHDYMEALEMFGEKYLGFCEKGWTIEEFRQMYENVDAVVDTPAFYFWEELLEAFPDAKVILTVRDDPDTWYNSLRKQVVSLNGSHLWYYYLFGTSGWRKFVNFSRKPGGLAYGGNDIGRFDPYFKLASPLLAKQMYRRHVAHLKHSCPKDKLLVYNCKEGWGPLCDFLMKQVPEEPFPRINVNSELSAFMWDTEFMKRERTVARAKGAIVCLAFAVFTWALWKRQ